MLLHDLIDFLATNVGKAEPTCKCGLGNIYFLRRWLFHASSPLDIGKYMQAEEW